MIYLKKIRIKNFLSFGNAWTEYDLNVYKSTLIRGKNGVGKSTIGLDAIMYALYGNPYRKINKPQLINSINNRDMVVELDFSIGGTEYMIRRGMKPNIFDIFKDSVLIEQDAATRDYQFFLETQILKVNERTFKQIAVLGSASYVPFMQLPAGQRRELCESVLNIEIFSKMNVVLRDRISATREEFTSITNAIALKKTEALGQQKLINVMKENTKVRVDELRVEKSQIESEITKAAVDLADTKMFLDALQEPDFDHAAFKTMQKSVESYRGDIQRYRKRIAEIGKMTECPSCLQKVEHEHVDSVSSAIELQIKETETKLYAAQDLLVKLDETKAILDDYYEEHHRLSNLVIAQEEKVSQLQNNLDAVNNKIQDLLSRTDDIEAEQDKLKSIGTAGAALIDRKNVIGEEKHLQDISIQLLKDTGIKTAVVKEYLPVLNALINKYLAMFEFFVEFTLDESFNEVIKSRARDIFSYSSFSEGEKQRINLSILLTFRQMAALKNSAKTNILVLDEILDSNLDIHAAEQAREILLNIPEANIIVMSHAEISEEGFDRVTVIDKLGDFSTIRS